MQVIKQPAAFQPFDIRIETADEARLVAELLGATNDVVCGAIGVKPGISFPMYEALKEHALQSTATIYIEPYHYKE